MSIRLQQSDRDDPALLYPGHATVDRTGDELAVEMLDELGDTDMADNGNGLTVADFSALANWARKGKPFRNVVAEYLARAQEVSPEAVAGLCAVLSDYVGTCCQGTTPDADGYADMFGIE